MGDYYWDDQIDYLCRTRGLYYNDDYLEFLVKTVWKIDAPVHMLDFGCGYGFLGLKLLPLLPEGSRYTGVDAGTKLIEKARELFRALPYETEFIVGDIQELGWDQNFDLAVCHAFLLHTPNSKDILRKMIGSVKDGGRIVCFEPHWISAMAAGYIEGLRQSEVVRLGLLQKLYEADAIRTGKDGNIGLKVPVYFSQLGVKDVECRVSDKVVFMNPADEPERAEELYRSMFEDGHGAPPGERDPFIEGLTERGLSEEEAVQLYESQLVMADTFNKDTTLTYAPNMKITFGRVERK